MNILILVIVILCIISFITTYSFIKEQSKPAPKQLKYITIHPITHSLLTREERILMNDNVNINELLNFAKYDLNPRQFEIFCTMMFKEFGCKAKLTKASNDEGRDIIVNDNIFIECKQYKAQNSIVGREICQKLLGAVQMFKAQKGIIINTGNYHNNAYQVEKQVDNLELWDLLDLKHKLSTLDNKSLKNIVRNTVTYNDSK